MKNIDAAWAAGFIDGEGCFYAHSGSTFQMKITVSQKNRQPLDKLLNLFQVGRIFPVMNGGFPAWTWNVCAANEIRHVINHLSPYLVLKADQASIMMQLAESSQGRRLTSDVKEQRFLLTQQLKNLKQT